MYQFWIFIHIMYITFSTALYLKRFKSLIITCMWNFLKDISKMLPFQMMNINSVYKINSLEYATGIIYSLHMVFDVMYNAGLRKTTQNNFFTGVCRVSGPRTYTPHTSFRTKQFWWRNCFQTALTCFQHMRSPW